MRHPIYLHVGGDLRNRRDRVAVPLFLAALVLFVAGTEIRVRTEETLLASQFGDEFQDFKRTVSLHPVSTLVLVQVETYIGGDL